MSGRKSKSGARPTVPAELLSSLALTIGDAPNPAAMVGALKMAIWDLGVAERKPSEAA